MGTFLKEKRKNTFKETTKGLHVCQGLANYSPWTKSVPVYIYHLR